MNAKQKFEEILGQKLYGHPEFYEILLEWALLHSKKNFQYAGEANPLTNFEEGSKLCAKLYNPNIKNKKLAYLLNLVSKQILAVYDMVGESKEGTVEEVYDKLSDIGVYSAIAMVLEKEDKK